jgi:hypothetical protein
MGIKRAGAKMKEELDKKLCEKYPKIFKNRNGSMQETCMYWGFSHGDGWYAIIDSLCASIQNHINNKRYQFREMSQEDFDEEHQVVAAQVKEKFGGLRFYIDGGDDWVYGAISMAESMSYRTCEVCGAPGVTRGTGWIRTTCDEHSKPGSED